MTGFYMKLKIWLNRVNLKKSAFPVRDVYRKRDIYKSMVHVFIHLKQCNLWDVYKVQSKVLTQGIRSYSMTY